MTTFKGTTKNDKNNGSKANDTLTGLAGSDTLSGGLGNDFIDGGVDNDLLNGENGDDTLIGDAGKDTLNGGSGNDNLNGGKDNDKLSGDTGNDTLNGGAGADTMTGGDGNDYYFVDNLKDFISETNKVVTTGGNDTIESVLLNYTLPANVENLILGGIEISNGTGNKSDNVITGNLADNYLRGDAGNDKLIGNAGVDTLDGGLGMDTLIGGDDSDVYFMNNTEDTIIETENGGDLDQVNATVTFNLNSAPNVEALELSGEKATDGTGNELGNLIQEKEGGTVANSLNGMAGDDTLDGAGGDDTLEGGEGNDILEGGDGTDSAIYNDLQKNYQITANVDSTGVAQLVVKYVGNADDVTADEGEDILSNIEILQFSDGSTINAADVIAGKWAQDSTPEPIVIPVPVTPQTPKPTTSTGSANDKILTSLDASKVQYGTKDADTIALANGSHNNRWVNGLGGNDTITGASHSDTLLGGAGDDLLNGGGDVDYLIGGSGIDNLKGGSDYADYFIFGTGDTGVGAAHDVIEDFEVKYDQIDLAGKTVVGSVGFGVPLTLFFSVDVVDFTAANQVRVVGDFENAQILVQINLDSDFSTVEAEIGLTGLMNLTAANFILTK
jgi:Ca2+-binding RTX toxin-like protein